MATMCSGKLANLADAIFRFLLSSQSEKMVSSESSGIFGDYCRESRNKSASEGSSNSSDSDNRFRRGKMSSKRSFTVNQGVRAPPRGPGKSPTRLEVNDVARPSNQASGTAWKSKGDKKEFPEASKPKKKSGKRKKCRKNTSSDSSQLSDTPSSSSSSSDEERKRRSRKQRKKKQTSSSSDSDSSYDEPSADDEHDSSKAKKFTLDKFRTKQLMNFLFKSSKTDELKRLRGEYAPKFTSKHFDLKRPKLDRQVNRRLKRVRSHEASRAFIREKNLANIQFQVLDVFRPLLYAWALIGAGDACEENPLFSAVVCAIKLLGNCFNYLSGQRRANVLRVTDPEYADVANDLELFDPKESGYL